MVRTKDAKVVISKSTRKITSASVSGKKQSAKGKNFGGGNPYHPRETPQWQKPITEFFKHPVHETDSPTLSIECTADKEEIMNTQDEAVAASNCITTTADTCDQSMSTATADTCDQSMSTATTDTCDQSMGTATADTCDQSMSNILICGVRSLPDDCHDDIMNVNVLEELPENN